MMCSVCSRIRFSPLRVGIALAFLLPGQGWAQDADRLGAAVAAACGGSLDPATEAVLAGVVVDSISGVFLPEAAVMVEWSEPGDTVSRATQVETDAGGFFAFCGLPGGSTARLQARLRSLSRPDTVDLEAGMVHMERLLLAFSDPLSPGVLVGRVIDGDTRMPVADATVRLGEDGPRTLTNTRGYFLFESFPWGVYNLQVQHLAYASFTAPVRVAGGMSHSVEIELSQQPIELEGITVTAEARMTRSHIEGLVSRMNRGFGSFITRERLEARPGSRVPDLLREVPGVEVLNRLGTRLLVRGRTCSPIVFVDGFRYYLDDVTGLTGYLGEELEAVEVYKGVAEIPGEFMGLGLSNCAAILLWTRRGG